MSPLVLRDHDGGTLRVDELQGVPHAVVFLPGAFTPVCTRELSDVDRLWQVAGAREIPVLAVSCDAPPVLAAWRRAEGVRLPLFSDFWPHGDVARRWEAFDERTGRPRRTSIVVGGDGRCVWREDATAAHQRDLRRLAAALDDL